MTARRAAATVLLAAATTAAVTGCAAKDSRTAPAATGKDLTVGSSYLPEPVDTGIAAAYFVVRNPEAADHLDRVTAPGFAREVQTHTTRNDRMIMVHGYDVPAHGSLTLSRGGNHLMLMHLSRMPRVGQTVTLRLYFAKAGRVDVRVPVKPATYRPPNGNGDTDMDGHSDHMGGGGHGEG